MSLVVAIVGATGAVGRTLLTVLEERRFPVKELRLLATTRSLGESLVWRGRTERVEVVDAARLAGCDLVFLSAGTEAARAWAKEAQRAGAAVVDNSYAFRMEAGVPLVVPEVNAGELEGRPSLVANPNCSTIALVLALAPLHRRVPVRRVVVSTYQSVSGTGIDALRELEAQVERGPLDVPPRVYPHPIAFNCIPQVDDFLEDGVTREERKLVHETRKILGVPDLPVTATTVRVPVRVAHSLAVNLEFVRPVAPEEARRWLAEAPGVLGHHKLSVGSSGFKVAGDHSSSEMRWSMIAKVQCTESHLFAFTGPMNAVIIPRQSLQGASFEEVRSAFLRHAPVLANGAE